MGDITYEIIGAASGLGFAPGHARQGPAALRSAGLLTRIQELGVSVQDGGDVEGPGKKASPGDPKVKFLKDIALYSEKLVQKLRGTYGAGRVPVIVGGDHSVSIASVSAAAEYLKNVKGKDAELGLLWIDAHPDVNTPKTTVTGNVHGMSVAILLGEGEKTLTSLCGFSPKLRPENMAAIGLRDVDAPERDFVKDHRPKTK